jgi:hypothetical protein
MHIVIDRKPLKFLPIKHESIDVIGNLIWIEAPHSEAWILPLDHNFLSGFSDLELMLLYKNTTGEPAQRVGNQLRNILFELAERIPVNDVNPFELNCQAELIPECSSERYTYLKGSFKPAIQDKLFKLEPVSLPRNENEAVIALRPRTGPPALARTPTATPAPAPNVNRPVAAPRGPRQGGVKELIWAVADKMWAAAGSSKDAKIVLNLRKEMMTTLEKEHSVKKTSSSNELGNWMKARI